ncbi:MAG: hypothetical protein NZ874_07275 [Fimbriimonadales bacterium]|nr:hypothetical protein [Fimbriimonadales bacterium]
MKRLVALITVIAVLVVGVAQQPQKNTSQQASSKPKKIGVFSAQGKILNFFSRGEGTLIVRGRGYLVMNTVQGRVQLDGFREVKELPRGVRIKPPLNQRLKVYMGQGTVRIEGKYDSVRAVLREARLEFKGDAAFLLQGVGTCTLDGVQRELSPVHVANYFVPEPNWMKPAQTQNQDTQQQDR